MDHRVSPGELASSLPADYFEAFRAPVTTQIRFVNKINIL